MPEILIGTYNMSFASDAGLNPNVGGNGNFASEAAFLLSNKTGNPRGFWINALEKVKDFIKQPNAAFIGLQEINKTPDGSNSGSGKIKTEIQAINSNFDVVTEEVIVVPNTLNKNGKITKQGVKPAVTIAWNIETLGKLKSHKIEDLSYTPEEKVANNITITAQKGRPMMMVLTENDYLLITIHAPNYNYTYTGNFDDLRKKIKEYISKFMNEQGTTLKPNKVFIVGDFNDRYDALQTIEISEGTILKYEGQSPKSCCHNWDSSCIDSRFERKSDLKGRKGRTDIGTCKSEGKILAGIGPRDEMKEEGNIENYRYHADKVFGETPESPIRMFPNATPTGPSTASDHEMVVATFQIPSSGGRSKKYRNKSRKTRKLKRRMHKKHTQKSRK